LPRYRTYLEPLLGGAALFFELRPKRAILSDTNEELIDCFTAVRDDVERVIAALKDHKYDRDHYYAVRGQDPWELDLFERAARMIYLNKTGFNGLYRVNKQGQFNVPFGRYTRPTICDEERLRACSAALRNAALCKLDFARCCEQARKSDLVYFDPPFIPTSETADFTSYTAEGFGCAKHYHLAGTFRELAQRGVRVMASNADTKLSRQLYRGFHIERVEVGRTVGCKDRGSARELIIRSFEVSRRGRKGKAA
jgi:DNA adenine methylase